MPPPREATTEPADAPARHPWRSLLRALLWLLLAEIASVCVAVLAGFIAGFTRAVAHAQGTEGWQPDLLFYALIATIALQGTLLLADLRQGRSAGRGNLAVGLGAGPMRRHRLIALFAGLMIAWVIGYVMALIRFQTFNAYVATRVPAVLTLPVSGGPILLAIMLLLAVAVAPLAEELFFRGWLWTALRRSWGVWPTALCTAGLWLGIHALDGPVRALILLPTAILLSLARHYGGSVRASLLVHVVNNATAVAIQVAARALTGP
ncbi:MAG TPA: CPBP family intramembrane glutamic endopeptidase [Acetobacteraceae bacterium]